MYQAACECPKCLAIAAEKARARKVAGIDHMEAEKAIEKMLRERERKFWPCGEPRVNLPGDQ